MSAKLYKTYNNIIKSIIIVVSIAFLINQLFVKQDFAELWNSFLLILESDGVWLLLLITLLAMPLNWTLEALKWKLLLADSEKISLGTALKAVLSGTTISAVSPNRTGDYLARVFVLNKTSFWNGVLITLIGSFAQNIVTLFFGGIAFFGLFAPLMVDVDLIDANTIGILKYVYFIILAIAIFLYYRISVLSSLIPLKWRKVNRFVSIFTKFKFNKLSIALLISASRYLVYSTQFYIIIKAMGFNELGVFHGLAIISSIFLLNTIRPSIALLEIGIRGSIAIFVFGLYYGEGLFDQNAVFAASSLIWIINIVLPAIIGLFFIKDLKFFRSRKGKDVS